MTMRRLTIGKWRGLGRCATPEGAFSVLALDHRNNLRRILRPDSPDEVPAAELSDFKCRVVRALAPASSAVLLDPEFGAAQCVAAGALPASTGLVVALEETGYGGSAAARTCRVLPGWSPEKARRMGADAVKLLIYYHPDSPTAAAVEDLVGEVADECRVQDLALMLEPLSYSLQPGAKLTSAERRRVVVETARRLTVEGVDLLKAEFPLDVQSDPDPASWAAACREVTAASPVPWIVLSAGVDFETYARQVVVACQAGAGGVAAGRAVWKELVELPPECQDEFLNGEAFRRTRRLTAICRGLARPFTDYWEPPEVSDRWRHSY